MEMVKLFQLTFKISTGIKNIHFIESSTTN